MPTATKTAEPGLSPAEFAARFSAIITQLIGFLALRLSRPPLLACLTPLLAGRLNRAARLIRAHMARIAQGKPPRSKRAPRPQTARPSTPRPKFPTAPGWLLRELKHEASLTRSLLESLLAEPGAAALLAQIPSVNRLLNPLRRALAIGHTPRPAKPPPPPPPPQPTPEPPRRRPLFTPFVRVL